MIVISIFFTLFLKIIHVFSDPITCTHTVYCEGQILDTIQKSRIFNDSKTFVDMPLKYLPQQVIKNFNSLPNHSIPILNSFISNNFFPAGTDLQNITPSDWKANITLFSTISDKKLREMAASLHQCWLKLFREFKADFFCDECTSFIKTANPFVVPGGRFREFYNWDNLWIVEGLLVSEMVESAMNVGLNIAQFIDKQGYMPNGARIQQVSRSQPPITSIIVKQIADQLTKANKSEDALHFINKTQNSLVKEHLFWETNRQEAGINLNQYSSNLSSPRPESYQEDYNLAAKQKGYETIFQKEIGAAAESGWDFSSRWCNGTGDLLNLETTKIAPVDLNTLLLATEKILSNFSSLLGLKEESIKYSQKSQIRNESVFKYFFDSETYQWLDQNIQLKSKIKRFYLSNYFPIYAIGNEMKFSIEIQSIINQLENITKSQKGGLPVSLINSSQQWDFPNTWAPLESMIYEGLKSINTSKSNEIARKIAEKWLINVQCSWINSKGFFFEKQDVTKIGKFGSGGEQEVQAGFGWTNGYTLKLIKENSDFIIPDSLNCSAFIMSIRLTLFFIIFIFLL